MKNIKVNIIPSLIYLIAFYMSFRNGNIYFFNGQNAVQAVVLDYIFLGVVLLTLILILIKKILNKKYMISKVSGIMMLLITWVLIQSIVNTVVSNSNMIPRNLLGGLFSFAVIVMGIDRKNVFNKAFFSFVIGSAVSALVPLIKFSGALGVRTTVYQGIYYPGGLWNSVLVSFVSCGWLILAFVQKKELTKKEILFLLSSFLFLFIGAFSGVSRTFILSIIASILVYTIATRKIKKVIQIAVIITIMLFLLELLLPETISRVALRFSGMLGNVSEEARITIWKTYLSNFSEYYLTGAIGDYLSYGPELVTFGPHSVFLNWLVQYGVLGYSMFIVLLSFGIKEVLSLKKNERKEFSFLLAWLCGYFIQITISETGFFESSFYVGLAFCFIWKKFTETEQYKYRQILKEI